MEARNSILEEHTELVVVNGECPVQTNDFDCGPWVTAMWLWLAISIDFWFTQSNMQNFRKYQASPPHNSFECTKLLLYQQNFNLLLHLSRKN